MKRILLMITLITLTSSCRGDTLTQITSAANKCGCVSYSLDLSGMRLGSFVTCTVDVYNKEDKDVKSFSNCMSPK
jgi:hypothetical protein